jgi:monoamine oxidase
MLEVAIVGGGLCGLALASSLHAQGQRTFGVFEARPRLGGRILSSAYTSNNLPSNGLTADLGPTWYWPETQPLISRLVAELGLASFVQHDTGVVLRLTDPDKAPDRMESEAVHGGARRITGGMATLVAALANALPGDTIQLSHELTAIADRGDHAELHFRCAGTEKTIQAKQVVLAMPPRLIEEHINFAPPLNGQVRAAMRATCTWMSDQAKVVIAYPQAVWREAGCSGNAFVTHEQAVIGEIHDACDADGSRAALGGFIALSPALRESFRDGLPILMDNQMAQVFGSGFGAKLEQGEQHYHDWATEPYTCSTLDRAPHAGHPQYGNPMLRKAQWGGKLHLAGAETAAYAGGYMEGALEAAARAMRAMPEPARQPEQAVSRHAHANQDSLARFSLWVSTQRSNALQRYRLQLNQGLATQNKDQLTQRALLGSVEQIYSEALRELDALPFDVSAIAIERGRSALTPDVLDPFDGFINALIEEAVQFNRTSCANSNFPGEHKPDQEYVQTIRRDLAAAWREFAFSANTVLVTKNACEGAING